MKQHLIKRYIETVKDNFPDLTDSEIAETINSTFKYFKMRMGDSDFPDIRIKGFGSFQVFPGPVLKEIISVNKKIKSSEYSEHHKEKLKQLENYVEKNPTLFKEYYERRKKSK